MFKNNRIIESNMMYSEYLNEFGIEDDSETKLINKYDRKKDKLPTSIRNEIKRLEEEMPKLENDIEDIKEKLSYETVDYEKIMAYTEELNNLEKLLDNKTTRYLELLEIRDEYK